MMASLLVATAVAFAPQVPLSVSRPPPQPTRATRALVLRGGADQTNYDSVSVALCESELAKADLPLNIVVDCSHANSLKKHELQPLVMENCINQIVEGNQSIVGLMIESNLHEGNQPIPDDLSQLKYGVSVTDACVSWEITEAMLRSGREHLLT